MERILVLEDNPDTREWLLGLAADAFPMAALTEAATLGAAWAVLDDGPPPGLALVDIGLPDGSGVELVAECGRRGLSTTCVMATIYEDDHSLFEALRAGARGYLLKDQPRERLIAQLAAVEQGEPPLSPAVARRMMRHFSERGTANQLPRGAGTTLSAREEEVLSLIARGYNRNDVALALGITANTAAGYIKNLYRKLEVSGRAEATLEAVQRGLVGRAPGGE